MAQNHALASGRVDEPISAAVRGLIAQRRLTVPRVALAVGISRTAFYNKLNNASPWEAEEVERLSRYFGVSRDSLFDGRADYRTDPGNVMGAFGTRSSTDRASDYGSEFGNFPPFRRPERRRRLGVVPLRLMAC
jgi:hypothetical protein